MSFVSGTEFGRAVRASAAIVALLGLSACSSSGGGQGSGSSIGNMLAFGSASPPPVAKEVEDEIDCPIVDIAEGGAAMRAGGEQPRYQISIGQTARECVASGGGAYTIKVGVELRALLGPGGAPGTFSAPLRIAVKSGQQVIGTRTRNVSVSIPSGNTQGSALVVEEGILVPPGKEDVIIELALGKSAAVERPQRRRR